MKLSSELRKKFLQEPPDHDGHAQCVIAMYPDKFKYTETHGWLYYTGTHWDTDAASAAVGRAVVNVLRTRKTLGDAEENNSLSKASTAHRWNVNSVRGMMQEQVEIIDDIANFDRDIFKINCRNGTVDLRSGRLTKHKPDDRFTYCLPLNYEPEADTSEWESFLESLGTGEGILHYLKRIAGYCLTGSTSEECLFYLYGPTRSGKGTFTETIKEAMGPLASGANFRTFTADRSGDTQNFDLAPLKNKRFIVAGESRRYEQMNEAVLKQVTGGDDIYCAHKGKDMFSYRPMFKIMLTSNHPVNADPSDTAVWTRLRVVHFPNSFWGEEDTGLKDRLKRRENLEGVLAWMVEGATEWFQKGLQTPDEVAKLTEEQRLLSDSVAQFIGHCCIVEPTERKFSVGRALYREYKDWCEEEGHMPKGRKSFTQSLSSMGIVTDRDRIDGKQFRGYRGIEFVGDGNGSFFADKVSQNGQVSQKPLEVEIQL